MKNLIRLFFLLFSFFLFFNSVYAGVCDYYISGSTGIVYDSITSHCDKEANPPAGYSFNGFSSVNGGSNYSCNYIDSSGRTLRLGGVQCKVCPGVNDYFDVNSGSCKIECLDGKIDVGGVCSCPKDTSWNPYVNKCDSSCLAPLSIQFDGSCSCGTGKHPEIDSFGNKVCLLDPVQDCPVDQMRDISGNCVPLVIDQDKDNDDDCPAGSSWDDVIGVCRANSAPPPSTPPPPSTSPPSSGPPSSGDSLSDAPPSTNPPAIDSPSSDSSAGDTSSGDTSSGDTSSGDTSSGDTSSGDTSSGDTSSGGGGGAAGPSGSSGPSGPSGSSGLSDSLPPVDISPDEEPESVPGPGTSFGAPPEVPEPRSWYQTKYENGLEGIWQNFSVVIAQTTFISSISKMKECIPSGGSCPSWNFNADLGMVNFGSQEIAPPCWLWDVLKGIMILSALFAARRLIFGG